MKYDTFLKEKERVEKLSVQEQKDFYAKVLEEEQQESSVKLLAYFQYAVLFYYEGDFRKAREILEPFAMSYQSYEYIPEMIVCFNLMGVASQCEGEYVLSRYFYTVALKIVKEQNAGNYYAYEYNNIALTYIAEKQFDIALEYIRKAEKTLPLSDKKMGAYIYLNKSDIYSHLGKLDVAEEAFEASLKDYNGLNFLPDDTLTCGLSLYYRIGDKEKYNRYINRIMDKLEDMYASEFIDACKVVFDCSLDSGNYPLVEKVIQKMDRYMEIHPNENRVGLKVEELKYDYAKKLEDQEAELTALEKKNHYYELIVSAMEEQRAESMEEYLEIHKHLQEAVHNETQANRAKTRFLSNMSHDIRTPMNAIVGITNLMEHSLHDPKKLENYLAKLQISNRYMLGLINDLLDMNKIESGVTYLNHESVKIAEEIQQIDDIIRPQAVEKELNLELRVIQACHENLLTDAVRLRQILINVLSNSVKYTPKGGNILFRVEEYPCPVSGKARYGFTIKDNGIGMSQSLLSHIFDPFIRGKDSVVNKIQGTGLGMSIVKSIVDLMGGNIEIDSKEGKGSCVTITLDIDIDSEEDAKMEPLNILLISENQDFVEKMMKAANPKPVSLFCARDEEEIDAVLEKQLMDVVLFDRFPERKKSIKKLRETVGCHILFLAVVEPTMKIQTEDLRREGINGKISRPFFFTNLEKEINQIRSNADGNAGESVLRGMHFLCAEDNELNGEILAASLEVIGASCRICEDGKKIVEIFQSVKPGEYDAILMDIQMPGMDGYEATRQIRKSSNPLGATIPIIAMTANAFLDDVKNSFAAGMNAHISKPIDMGILERTIRRLKIIKG